MFLEISGSLKQEDEDLILYLGVEGYTVALKIEEPYRTKACIDTTRSLFQGSPCANHGVLGGKIGLLQQATRLDLIWDPSTGFPEPPREWLGSILEIVPICSLQ